ncbi:MAG: electron transfer flavoprotein subunit beta/FixA family protein [Candidatus Stahlbacteria bacterium]|nr:electron transfer flavoprotein subunit beta/FixA family protein [Candidatus Stahlbacteria bacterium]
MNIVVCIKRVPETSESEIKVDESGKDIIKTRLTFDINESDNYALEEAILIKEKLGGTVTAISCGSPDNDATLRMAIAKGADTAIRIDTADLGEEVQPQIDSFKIAQLLKTAISKLEFDIILTGCMAKDDGYSQVGQMVAELLGIPHAALVTEIKIDAPKARAKRELEAGLLEVLDITLPALFTIQTGINEPRYASLIAIRRAAAKEIKILKWNELGMQDTELRATIESLFPPPIGKRAEILQGTTDETATKLTNIVKEKGLI